MHAIHTLSKREQLLLLLNNGFTLVEFNYQNGDTSIYIGGQAEVWANEY